MLISQNTIMDIRKIDYSYCDLENRTKINSVAEKNNSHSPVEPPSPSSKRKFQHGLKFPRPSPLTALRHYKEEIQKYFFGFFPQYNVTIAICNYMCAGQGKASAKRSIFCLNCMKIVNDIGNKLIIYACAICDVFIWAGGATVMQFLIAVY